MYFQANPDVYLVLELFQNLVENPFSLGYSVLAPLVKQICYFGYLIKEEGTNPTFTTITWSSFTTFLNTVWNSYGLQTTEIASCFSNCSNNQTALNAVFGDSFESLAQEGSYNLGYAVYYQTLNNQGGCQAALSCAMNTSDVSQLLSALKITNKTLLYQFLNSQPGQLSSNLSSIYSGLTSNPTGEGNAFVSLLNGLSSTINNINNESLFMYEFYSYLAINFQIPIPLGYWGCYDEIQTQTEYSMWKEFAQSIKEGGPNRSLVISNLENYWNNGGMGIWSEITTIWEFCLATYSNDYILPKISFNFWDSNFTSYANLSLYALPDEQFWYAASTFANGLEMNNPEMAADGVTAFISIL